MLQCNIAWISALQIQSHGLLCWARMQVKNPPHRLIAGDGRDTGGGTERTAPPKSFSRSRRRCRCRRAWPSGCCCAWPPGRRCRCRRAWPPGRRCDKPPRLPAAVLDCRSAGPPPLEGSGPIASASGRWLRTRALLPSIDWYRRILAISFSFELLEIKDP